ncbi:MAG: orotate phosphoribosyltransferase [Deltaproteobacteria bacterium]
MSGDRERLKQILRERSIFRGNFTLASGRQSPYYIDARRSSLDPEGAYLIAKIFLAEILKTPQIVSVGGPTMGADPIVGSILALSHENGSPLRGFLVRKEEKSYGRGKLIEGNLNPSDCAAIVEDVATTGGSILKAISAVEAAGAKVAKSLVVVDREEGARERFCGLGYEFYSIFSIGELL